MSSWLPDGTTEWGGRPVARTAAEVSSRCRVVLAGEISGVGVRRWTPRRPTGAAARPGPGGRGDAPPGAVHCLVEATIRDGTGEVLLRWLGRERVPGVVPGARMQVEGTAGYEPKLARYVLLNPLYRFSAQGSSVEGGP